MSTYTPGPWSWEGARLVSKEENVVLDAIPPASAFERGDRVAADARLIAAAPDLLEALMDIMTTMYGQKKLTKEMMKVAGAAIDRAKG